jgi:protein-S-isoprenylcysteine O-methyltransferase Ste14
VSYSTGAGGSTSERVRDVILGLTFLTWGVVGVATADRVTPGLALLTLLNGAVGLLFLVRFPCARHGSWRLIAASLPSVAAGGVALHLAPPLSDWPHGLEVLFVASGSFALVAFAYLSRSFAILPALRPIVVRGPYSFVRHPAYAGELCIVIACAAATGGVVAFTLPPVALFLVVVRIHAEERLLLTEPAYVVYAKRVRFRLVPGIW